MGQICSIRHRNLLHWFWYSAFFRRSFSLRTPQAWLEPNIPGHCGTNVFTLYITATVLNLVGDISIVAAPIPLIWSLRMSLPTKAALTRIFLLGES